ncbi:uncharacterized protein LOC9654920 [Selaginella moellendorffii]|uniref:uncharacterized protein LOC9654920 n=1 Tax=Selaginella moellendorffii TaxID=88036 RepID=UPI000D1C9220|nr:uncharacterized protein LOC9654920 [Selaginella moellendorffii]|eukprot:XP_024544379.1 uncharacterized protein LOC9654920 [Selaginella moellendorffii]
MKKPAPALIPADEEAAAVAQQRLAAADAGGAMDSSSVSASSRAARGGDNGAGDEQPREGGQESVVVERRGDFAVVCKWTIVQFSKVKARSLWSKYFQVGGYDCRLLVYPRGDSQALPGYLSIYLQVTDPSSSSKWDCFASYRLCVVNQRDESKSIQRDSWHRFSVKKKSHGWCDFTPSTVVLDPKSGFLVNESVLITTEILILSEVTSFNRDNNDLLLAPPPEALSGKFTWKVQNLSLFRDMIKTQKIMSPVFTAGECNLRLSVYQSSVGGVEYLSMCLESKDTEKTSSSSERSCWCLFRMSVLNQKPGLSHMHRDSYGRFAGDNKSGDNTSLGWNDYMKISDFMAPEMGYLVDDSATFTASFHVIKESSSFVKTPIGNRSVRKSDGYQGKFLWKIENFTKLKDLLKKRRITGLCIKSKRFQVGNRDCRLIVYPRGQSQPPCHLSMFLEVTDSRNSSADWSCFVSHRLSVVNHREERSVIKESQNRYCKAAKDWGWREFITLTNLFDQDSGFLVQDMVTFSAEVLILKETSMITPDCEGKSGVNGMECGANQGMFTWRVENFLAFKEIMETRKIFSKFFQAGGCELRIGVYESFDTLCIYLESDQSPGTDPDRNFWVRYRMAVVNQKHADRTVWKESSICTKTWNNSVLQFMKVSDMVEPDGGFMMRDTIVFVCEILDCCPWFEFSDLEVLVSDDDQDALSTDPDELLESDDSDGSSEDEEDIFRNLLARAGFHMSYGDNPQRLLDPREKVSMDAGAVAAFLTDLRVYLDDPVKVKRLLLPAKVSTVASSCKLGNGKEATTSPSLMNLFMGVKVLQQAIVDLLLDIMVECCQPAESKKHNERQNGKLQAVPESAKIDLNSREGGTAALNEEDSAQRVFNQRLDDAADGIGCLQAVQSCEIDGKRVAQVPESEPSVIHSNELRWPEQSEELFRLIVNSLRALDGAVPQGCPEPRRRPQSAQKMALVLERAPKYLQHDLLALVPKLVDPSEHQSVASTLLDWLQRKDTDINLRLAGLGALVQLDLNTEVWEQILQHALRIFAHSEDEALIIIITYIFKAAAKCYQLPQAVKAVRGRLKMLGTSVSPKVLEVVRDMIFTCPGVGEALLRDIDADSECSDSDGLSVFGYGGQGDAARIADVDILLEMLNVSPFVVEAQRLIERVVARGTISNSSVYKVLCIRRVGKAKDSGDAGSASRSPDSTSSPDCMFTALLALVKAISSSKDSKVREFVSTLYTDMFKLYCDDVLRERMVRGLVERATSSSRCGDDDQLEMNILTLLVKQEEGKEGKELKIVPTVLRMMRKAVQQANAECSSIRQQLSAREEELAKVRSDKQNEVARFAREKASLSQRLSEAEAGQLRVKLELKGEIERLSRDKNEAIERLRDTESQLEWSRSEREDEQASHASERKRLEDRLRDAESQISQFKRKRDDLKRITKEKTALAERLKSTEAVCANYAEEFDRLSAKSVTRDELCRSQEEDIRNLKEALERSEEDSRGKDLQISQYKSYAHNMDTTNQALQERVESLQSSIREELHMHAPLYGVGLETLSFGELEILARIHDEGLRQVRALQMALRGDLHAAPPPPPRHFGLPAVARPSSNGTAGFHGSGRANGTVSSWFPSTS